MSAARLGVWGHENTIYQAKEEMLKQEFKKRLDKTWEDVRF